jgi:hypothetical protein
MTARHVPLEQVKHPAVQAVLQQTPSTQKSERQSAAAPQDSPKFFFGAVVVTQVPRPSQTWPATVQRLSGSALPRGTSTQLPAVLQTEQAVLHTLVQQTLMPAVMLWAQNAPLLQSVATAQVSPSCFLVGGTQWLSPSQTPALLAQVVVLPGNWQLPLPLQVPAHSPVPQVPRGSVPLRATTAQCPRLAKASLRAQVMQPELHAVWQQ